MTVRQSKGGGLPGGWIGMEADDEADLGKRHQIQGEHYQSALHYLCASVLYDLAGDPSRSRLFRTAGTGEYAAWAASPTGQPARLDGCTCGGIGNTGAHAKGCQWASR